MKTSAKLKGLGALTLLVFFMTTCVAALGQADNQNEAQKRVLTPLEKRMQTRISVEFRDLPIDDAIRIIAEKADVDIVKSPKVIGNVTATLTDVPLEEAMNNILAAHGYGLIKDKSMVRIVPSAEIVQEVERLISKIYRITYADAEEVAKALEKFKSGQGMVSFNKGTSDVIVTDVESKIKAIDTFILQIDRMTPQILVEVRIYDITSRDKFDLGIEWDAGRRTFYDSAGEPIGGRTDPFIVSGFEGATNKTADSTLGFFRFGLLNESIDIDAQLRAEQENTDAKLLANPRILVLDNEEALFDIVTEHPYVERTISGATITESVKFKNVGVKLVVTPHVTRGGMLRLHILPEFNVLVGRVNLSTDATNVPVVDTRKVDTIALVKDRQTVVLGGLRKKDVSKQINKIPLLGDLPVLGGLFRFEGEDTAVTELVVFITPQIVEQPVIMAESERQAYEVTEFSGPTVDYTRAEKSEESEE
ncbi:MAG: secretin N-terminal domain-containing protein [Planctomycetota bacterium]